MEVTICQCALMISKGWGKCTCEYDLSITVLTEQWLGILKQHGRQQQARTAGTDGDVTLLNSDVQNGKGCLMGIFVISIRGTSVLTYG